MDRLPDRLLLGVVLVLLLALQWRLWIGEGSLRHVASLEEQVTALREENAQLAERNRWMAADVEALKSGLDRVEEIARRDLGMIREGETFFLIPETVKESPSESAR